MVFVKARNYSWRKTAGYFHKEIGPGTRFDMLPMETLKLIFKHKVIVEALDVKKERKSKKEKAKYEKKLEAIAVERKRQEIIEEQQRERKARGYKEDSEKLVKRFGSLAKFNTEHKRKIALRQSDCRPEPRDRT